MCGKFHTPLQMVQVFISASSLFLGFLAFEPPLLGLLGKGDCLSHLWGKNISLLLPRKQGRPGVDESVCICGCSSDDLLSALLGHSRNLNNCHSFFSLKKDNPLHIVRPLKRTTLFKASFLFQQDRFTTCFKTCGTNS